jgi:hypothetical protein
VGLRRVVRDEQGTLLRAAERFTARPDGYPAITGAKVTVRQHGEFVVVGLDFEEPAVRRLSTDRCGPTFEQSYLRVAPGVTTFQA